MKKSRLRLKKVDFEYRILDFEYRILDFDYRILDFDHRILDFDYRILDFDYRILDFEYRILDFDPKIFDFVFLSATERHTPPPPIIDIPAPRISANEKDRDSIFTTVTTIWKPGLKTECNLPQVNLSCTIVN